MTNTFAVIIPPTPLRVGIYFIVLFLVESQYLNFSSTSKNLNVENNYISVFFPGVPYYAPLWGIAHVLAVHTSSLWSDRVHNVSSTLLLESSIYYALIQAVMIGFLHVYAVLDDTTLWITASHCSAYYAWFVISTAKMLPNSTLSYSCLYFSMLNFCCFTVPYAISSETPPNTISTHSIFVAWTLADICSYFHKCLIAPSIKVTPIITLQ
jgi:hypothetical protein